jgi:hypothetical protein
MYIFIDFKTKPIFFLGLVGPSQTNILRLFADTIWSREKKAISTKAISLILADINYK